MNARIENKLGGRKKSTGLGNIMRPGVILMLVLISVFSFGALLALSGFAGDLRSENNGRAHALSNSAVGYAGIVELLRADQMDVTLSRKDLGEGTRGALKVITLSRPYQLPEYDELNSSGTTLIILPKWYVTPMQERPGWVRQAPEPIGPVFNPRTFEAPLKGYLKGLKVMQVEGDDGTLTYDIGSEVAELPAGRDFNIQHLQFLEGEKLISVMTANRRTVLAQVDNSSVYILSEPDLLNTMGLSLKTRARFGQDLINGLIEMDAARSGEVVFDLSVHGFGRTQNLIKTLLTPPFLAATLCLLAAGALIGWQAFARFGDSVSEERDYELGKYTLADNGARFIKIAGKEIGMAEGYINLMRRLTAKDFYMDRQSQSDIETFLDSREDKLKMTAKWAALENALLTAESKDSYLQTAKDIHQWRQEITYEHK